MYTFLFRHLICADSNDEMFAWAAAINSCLSALQGWMPDHFACLSRYDARQNFYQPVSANIASRLKSGGRGRGLDDDDDDYYQHHQYAGL